MKKADKNVRLGNLIIDGLVIFTIQLLISLLFSASDSASAFIVNILSAGSFIQIAFLYYLIFESINGKTLGKMVTGTIVVNKSGVKPSFLRILFRSILRITQWNIISLFLGTNCIHDRWTGTYVVSKTSER